MYSEPHGCTIVMAMNDRGYFLVSFDNHFFGLIFSLVVTCLNNWSLIYIIPDSTSDYLSTLQSTLHEIFAVHDQNEDSMVIE